MRVEIYFKISCQNNKSRHTHTHTQKSIELTNEEVMRASCVVIVYRPTSIGEILSLIWFTQAYIYILKTLVFITQSNRQNVCSIAFTNIFFLKKLSRVLYQVQKIIIECHKREKKIKTNIIITNKSYLRSYFTSKKDIKIFYFFFQQYKNIDPNRHIKH